MIGTQRSGSNLLRVMLDGLDGITAPHPPHILQRFLPLLDRYGDLGAEANFRSLAVDVCELVRINPVPWTGVTLDADEVVRGCKGRTLFDIYRTVYETAARQHGASIWVNKSMKNAFYADGIEATGLRPKYIYLYRDGRDVALSFQKAIVGEKHVYAIAKAWKKDQEEAFRLIERIPAARFFSLSYENLTDDPEQAMRKICAFLGVAYSDKAMDYYNSGESRSTAAGGEMWRNVTRPVMKHNTGKFMTEMSPDELAIFESVAGDTLVKLGYALVTPPSRLRTSFEEEEIRGFEEENARLKRAFAENMSAADIEKRRPQAELLRRIAAREVQGQ